MYDFYEAMTALDLADRPENEEGPTLYKLLSKHQRFPVVNH